MVRSTDSPRQRDRGWLIGIPRKNLNISISITIEVEIGDDKSRNSNRENNKSEEIQQIVCVSRGCKEDRNHHDTELNPLARWNDKRLTLWDFHGNTNFLKDPSQLAALEPVL